VLLRLVPGTLELHALHLIQATAAPRPSRSIWLARIAPKGTSIGMMQDEIMFWSTKRLVKAASYSGQVENKDDTMVVKLQKVCIEHKAVRHSYAQSLFQFYNFFPCALRSFYVSKISKKTVPGSPCRFGTSSFQRTMTMRGRARKGACAWCSYRIGAAYLNRVWSE
jgi:hypothetical protein